MWETILAILGKLFGGASPGPRVDFESVTAMWERLSERLTSRISELEAQVNVLETKLGDCRKHYDEEHRMRIELSLRISGLEAEVKHHRGDDK